MIHVAVVAASYFLVMVVENLFFDASFYTYYFALLCTTTVVIWFCTIRSTPLLSIYACLQFIQGCFYLFIINDNFDLVERLLWDYPLNFSLILTAFEFAIIVNGVINVIPVNHRLFTAHFINCNDFQNYQKGDS